MASPLVTLDDYKAFAGLTGTTDSARDVSLNAILAGVEAALRELTRPWLFEDTTFTNCVLDAPTGDLLILPTIPVRSISSVYLRFDAHGVVANFTSDYLLAADGTDYQLVIDDPVNNWSRSGTVRRVGSSGWGVQYRRPVGRLGRAVEPGRGAVLVNYTAGMTTVPDNVAQAVMLATSMIYGRRLKGAPFTSESWNGRSESVAGPFTTTAALLSPDCAMLLAPYMPPKVASR